MNFGIRTKSRNSIFHYHWIMSRKSTEHPGVIVYWSYPTWKAATQKTLKFEKHVWNLFFWFVFLVVKFFALI
jgi:hypothetical protein